MKKILIAISTIIILSVAYYLITPIFDNVTLDEPEPENAIAIQQPSSGVENLSPEERGDLETQMQVAQEKTMPEMNEAIPNNNNEQVVTNKFEIMGTPGHPASGTVRIIETKDGKTFIRFENLETINGPNLHIYLSKDLEVSEYIDLGPIKGTDGNINYEVPEGVNIQDYRYVMHWCVPFKVLFNYAEIN